jgi:hypothetical protein
VSPLRPEDLNLSALPRGRLGHLKTDAVADLLRIREGAGEREHHPLGDRRAV